jgi:hypothetical protein
MKAEGLGGRCQDGYVRGGNGCAVELVGEELHLLLSHLPW